MDHLGIWWWGGGVCVCVRVGGGGGCLCVTCLQVAPQMCGCGAGRKHVAARRAWLWGALQAPVPPHRYPAAHHHVLLIYCYTGFHN